MSATWNGMMVGAITSGADNNDIVQGDAMIGIDNFSSENVDVVFSEIINLNTGNMVEDGTMTWTGLTLTSGAFDDKDENAPNGFIKGRFYGATHGKVGGVFERDDIVGAFGATRQP